MRRDQWLWAASAVLMVWIGLLSLDQSRAVQCTQQGGRWETLRWRCVPDAGRIILQREIRRSEGSGKSGSGHANRSTR
jgi:hypothetical protein